MRTLETLDIIVIIAFLVISLGAGLVGSKKAGKSMTDFFLSGRSLPWWLAGVSMAATNFSIDTPLAITKYVSERGIAGVWFFWASAISALLAAFLFARLWRRAEVVTDAELIELRYSGKPAAGLRLFKGLYFGVFINCYVLGWVLKAVLKIMAVVTDVPPMIILVVAVVVAFAYTVTAGLKGVVVTDFVQYGITFVGSTVLAVLALKEVGGIDGLLAGLDVQVGSAEAATRFIPMVFDVEGAAEGAGMAFMPLSVFLVYAMMQWWAHKYADGGGKHIQRMLACKTEGHAQGASVTFAILNYGIQVWPWIITALCALVLLGPLEDPELGYPMLMTRLLPAGLLGLLVVSMLGAFMSTVDTHLNLGAAYLVNDVYKRFVKPDADQKHYVLVSRLSMIIILGVSVVVALSIDSIGDAWKFILSFAAGAGMVWIVRWFWWRVNAWSEFSAMLTSGVVATVLAVGFDEMIYTTRLVIVVGVSTVVWLVVTFLTEPVPDDVLLAFVERVRPGRFGWARLGSTDSSSYLLSGLIDWALSVVALFAGNFALGSFVLGDPVAGAGLLVLAVAFGASVVWRIRRRVLVSR